MALPPLISQSLPASGDSARARRVTARAETAYSVAVVATDRRLGFPGTDPGDRLQVFCSQHIVERGVHGRDHEEVLLDSRRFGAALERPAEPEIGVAPPPSTTRQHQTPRPLSLPASCVRCN